MHALRAFMYQYHDLNFAAADAEIREALRLDPEVLKALNAEDSKGENMNATQAPVKNICVLVVLIVAAAVPMSSQAARNDSSQSVRRYINLPKPVQAPFSDGVLVGNTLFIAGRLGLDPTTGKPPDDVEQEARIVLDGLKSVLTEAGMTMDDLVFVQVFCPDVSLYPKFNEIYKTYFGKDYPARAFVGSGALLRGVHFEINGIAVKR